MNYVKQRLQCVCPRPYNRWEIDQLQLKEMMAFYEIPNPRTLSAKLSTIKASFPFMKLPPEIRIMIYNLHFFQPADGDSQQQFCAAGEFCRFRRCNNDIPVRMLFMLSKAIYAEAMPLYYRTKTFRFYHCRVASFLAKIGPDQRQHVTKVAFNLKPYNARVEIPALLGCPSLRELTIVVDDAVGLWAGLRRKGLNVPHRTTHTPLELLLRIRSIERVTVSFLIDESNRYTSSAEKKIRKELVDTLQTLEQRYAFKKRPLAGSVESPILISDD